MAGVDGLDDLGVVDALEVDEVMPRLLFPSWRWMTISGTPSTRHLDGVGVPELVWGETPADACSECRPP